MIFDNANPKILDTSELALHRERRKNKSVAEPEETVMDILLDNKFYKIDPFYTSEHPDSDSDSGSSTEPIDEQEIYGKSLVNLN